MKFLTRQEQMFLAVVLGMLLTGWGVKWYRMAHPTVTPGTAAVEPTK